MPNCETCQDVSHQCALQEAFRRKKGLGFNNETGEIFSNLQSIGYCPEAIGIQEKWAESARIWLDLASMPDSEIINKLGEVPDFPVDQAKTWWGKVKPRLDEIRGNDIF